MIRNFYRRILLFLANYSIRKYNTKVVYIYGWDWSEGLRESLYNLLHSQQKVRRNTKWITWDFAVPLFVLGQPYDKELSKFQLNISIIKSLLYLFKPNKYKNNYLVISIHAKSKDTLAYWLSLQNIDSAILLPSKSVGNEDNSEVKLADEVVIEMLHSAEHFVDLRDAARTGKLDQLTENKTPYINNIQTRLLYLLEQIEKHYISNTGMEFDGEDMVDAVVKVDWESLFLKRISNNLMAEIDGSTQET